MHKYKIGDNKSETYEFDSDLEFDVNVTFRNSIGRNQDLNLTKLVEDQISDKKTGLVSYILFENNKILVDENRKSQNIQDLILHTQLVSLLYL